MGFCSAVIEISQRPHPTYILASPYLRHFSGRFTSYFPNKTSYKLLPRTTLDQILNHTNLHHTATSYFSKTHFNPLNAELSPICHLLALLGAHHILHVSRIRVNITFPSMSGYSNLSSLNVLWSKCFMQSQTFYMSVTCSAHLIFLDLYTAVIPQEEAKLWSSATRQYLE